jgi:archaellum component FlaC
LRALTAVVEGMRSDFKAFGTRLEGLDDKMTAGFARVDERLDGVDERLDGVDQRLDGVEQRLSHVEGQIADLSRDVADLSHDVADLSHEVGLVKVAVLEHGRDLKRKVDRDEVEAVVERVVARMR